MPATLGHSRFGVLDNPPKYLDYPATSMPAVSHLKGTQFFTDPHFRLRVMRVPQHGVSHQQHTHDFAELVVILGGHGQHQVGREVYDISAGDVFVLLGSTSHCYPVTKDLLLINILYDPANLRLPRADLGTVPGYHALFEVEPRFRQRQRFQNRLKLDMEQLGQLAKLIAELEGELRSHHPGARFLATAHFMRIMAFVARAYSKLPVEEQRPVTQLSKVLGYIEQHFAEPLTVANLARVAHLSETSLFRLFRQILGRSPVDYLIRLRVQKAGQLLRREPIRIKEVSEAVGFADSNYFTRQFRKVMGVSPREYQRRK
ncbi:MAG: HTH-type transcriptional activator RhaR [Verrucomicrobiae bacterium]|nr:HTH-type transcriptional activator RhaR [Verrucomicrobiae bacterium]